MANYRVAKRYAKAYMEVIPEGQLENAVGEMKDILLSLKQIKQLRAFLKSPIISEEKKAKVAETLFEHYIPETQKLIQILIKNSRIENLKEVAESVIQQYRLKKGIRKVVVTSAYPLATEQIDAIVEKVQQDLGVDRNKIEIEQKIDETLIGGFVLRVDDKQFDSSIKTRLNKIKQEFNTIQVTS